METVPRRRRDGRPAEFGVRGEEAAERFLRSLGFRILERRFRARGGEVDLVAMESGTLVFVEVKSRGSLACGRPAEAVDGRKRARLLRAAAWYLAAGPGPDRPCRFDVVEVLEDRPGRLRLHLIRDAFQAP
jgi:putative endonuclease